MLSFLPVLRIKNNHPFPLQRATRHTGRVHRPVAVPHEVAKPGPTVLVVPPVVQVGNGLPVVHPGQPCAGAGHTKEHGG